MTLVDREMTLLFAPDRPVESATTLVESEATLLFVPDRPVESDVT